MIKAVLFDTFGTIVDWRSSIAREGAAVALQKGLTKFDSDEFARAWRAGYRPGMARVTVSKSSFVYLVSTNFSIISNREFLRDETPSLNASFVLHKISSGKYS